MRAVTGCFQLQTLSLVVLTARLRAANALQSLALVADLSCAFSSLLPLTPRALITGTLSGTSYGVFTMADDVQTRCIRDQDKAPIDCALLWITNRLEWSESGFQDHSLCESVEYVEKVSRNLRKGDFIRLIWWLHAFTQALISRTLSVSEPPPFWD